MQIDRDFIFICTVNIKRCDVKSQYIRGFYPRIFIVRVGRALKKRSACRPRRPARTEPKERSRRGTRQHGGHPRRRYAGARRRHDRRRRDAQAGSQGLRRSDTERKKAQERICARYTLALFFGYVKRAAVVGVGWRGAAQRGLKQA